MTISWVIPGIIISGNSCSKYTRFGQKFKDFSMPEAAGAGFQVLLEAFWDDTEVVPYMWAGRTRRSSPTFRMVDFFYIGR